MRINYWQKFKKKLCWAVIGVRCCFAFWWCNYFPYFISTGWWNVHKLGKVSI